MKTTYIIESNDGMIAQYERRYSYARSLLEKLGKEYSLLKVCGYEYGEGYPVYRISYNEEKQKFERKKLR